MTSITIRNSDSRPRISGAPRGRRLTPAATVAVVPSARFRGIWQAMLSATQYFGDARVAWATAGALVSLATATTLSAS